MHAAKILYVLADGGRARFVTRDAEGHFRTVREFESPHIHQRSHELGRRAPARVDESASPTRHAVEARSNPKDKSEHAFIDLVAAQINSSDDVPHHEMLVIAATPRVLDHFKRQLSNTAAAKLKAAINKDLTKIPDDRLSDHLPGLFAAGGPSS